MHFLLFHFLLYLECRACEADITDNVTVRFSLLRVDRYTHSLRTGEGCECATRWLVQKRQTISMSCKPPPRAWQRPQLESKPRTFLLTDCMSVLTDLNEELVVKNWHISNTYQKNLCTFYYCLFTEYVQIWVKQVRECDKTMNMWGIFSLSANDHCSWVLNETGSGNCFGGVRVGRGTNLPH